jgi:hypothetical protein
MCLYRHLIRLNCGQTRDTDTNHSWGGNRSGVSSIFVNTLHTALQAPAWEELLQRYVCSCIDADIPPADLCHTGLAQMRSCTYSLRARFS